jgi:hypothetical protein
MNKRELCGVVVRGIAVALATLVYLGRSADAAVPEPGLEITAANVDEYAEYLAPSMVMRVKQGEILKVFPTSPVEKLVYPKWLEMTRNPAQKAVMLDEAGTWGLPDGSPWPGGFPFPEPKNAREIMANFQYHITSDDIDTKVPGNTMGDFYLVDQSGKLYKKNVINLTQRRMTSRVWVAPLGVEPGYENELYRTNTLFFEPYDVKGLVSMNIIYRDQAKLPDGYVYVPVLRRVRRQSATQRADSIAGSDLTLGDVDTFSDPLGMWDFKLLETKKLLSGQNHQTGSIDVHEGKAQMIAGRFPYPYSAVELRDTYVIEATPRYDTIYSKKILRVDTETYRPSVGEFFDRQGKLLKSYVFNWVVLDDFTPNPTWITIQNMQTNNSTAFCVFELVGNAGTPLTRVLTSSMKDFGR